MFLDIHLLDFNILKAYYEDMRKINRLGYSKLNNTCITEYDLDTRYFIIQIIRPIMLSKEIRHTFFST